MIQPLGQRLLQQLPLAAASRIVDVGAGAGALLPAIQRAAPGATVVGIDRSRGMLNLARAKHRGPLAVMDAQQLGLPDAQFDVAVAAFILFHLPHPERCLREIWRVLRPGGAVGIVTWASEDPPFANSIWDEELAAAGARAVELPATDNRTSCNSTDKVTALFEGARFDGTEVSTEQIEHRWPPPDHFEWHVRSTSRMRLMSLGDEDRRVCLGRIRDRLAGLDEDQHTFRGEVFVATAVRPSARHMEVPR